MSKLSELLAEYAKKKNLNFSEKSKLLMCFSEALVSEEKPTEEEKTEVSANLEKEAEAVEEKKVVEEAKEVTEDEKENKKEDAVYSELSSKLSESQEKLAKIEKKLKFSELSTEFDKSFAFSESNRKGVFKTNQKEAFVNFSISLNDEQKAKFGELIGGIDTSLS